MTQSSWRSSRLPYRGRFAPSPSGPLHFGSLLAAVASCLQARSRNGLWYVRIDDLDPPRELAGAAQRILDTLVDYGFVWDGDPIFQSQRIATYESALAALNRLGATYACACSRKEIADSSIRGIDGLVYPGTCRAQADSATGPHALRVHSDDTPILFEDLWQGSVQRRVASDYGDFVVRRADGLVTYQLACAVDDADVTEVIRGADLLESTPRQIFVQRLLGLTTPSYGHFPVATNEHGEKLSKQTRAPAIHKDRAASTLVDALHFLGQAPPMSLRTACVADVWTWAMEHWRTTAVPHAHARTIETARRP